MRRMIGPSIMVVSLVESLFNRCLVNRGIDVVRNRIKMFAQKKVTLPPGRHKIIILDEADRCAWIVRTPQYNPM